MKIYDEVTIDMNPESSTYGEHLSEESIEYTGDVALCGSAEGPSISGDPRPGITAMGRGGGKFPTALDPAISGSIPELDIMPGGTAIDMTSQMAEGVDQGDYTSTRKGKFLGTGTRRNYDEAEEKAFSSGFREGWYDPYLDVALKTPMQQIRERGFEKATTENTGLSQDVINQYLPEGYAGTSLEGERVIEKGSLTDLGYAQEDLDLAKTEAEEAKTGALEDIDLAEEEATLEKRKALQEGNIKRAQLAEGTLGAEQATRAGAATSGFAYSGPQAQSAAQQREQGTTALGDIARSQQDIESQYQRDLEGFETSRGDVASEYDKAVGTAETDYGRAVGGALDAASQSVSDLIGAAGDLVGSHTQFGDTIVQGVSDPGWSGFGKAANITGQTGYSAPGEGWFRDAPEYQPTIGHLGQHQAAYANLRNLAGKDMIGPGSGEGSL